MQYSTIKQYNQGRETYEYAERLNYQKGDKLRRIISKTGRKKRESTLTIIKEYPHLYLCQNKKGNNECVLKADIAIGEWRKVNED